MTYGIAGNTRKDALWQIVADLVEWMSQRNIAYRLHAAIASGLTERGLRPRLAPLSGSGTLAEHCDVILSIGGDGTLLRTAFETGSTERPILGINIGRLGFLADVEVGDLYRAVERLEEGAFELDSRLALAVTGRETSWALNDAVIMRAGASGGLLAMDVHVDGTPLNQYWGDGLIVATPTGSTGYALAVGGPIVMPGSDVVLVSPVAPHSLTVRPVVLPVSSVIEIVVAAEPSEYELALDGRIAAVPEPGNAITIQKASHTVQLVKLAGKHYFQTLRSKLSWGS